MIHKRSSHGTRINHGMRVNHGMHIHRNQPGILTQINQAFAEKGINIEAQYLQTTAEIGYVVVDVQQDRAYDALAQLQQIDGTIKTRILH